MSAFWTWLWNLSNMVGLIGTVAGILGTIFSWLAWHKSRQVEKFLEREKQRQNERIEVILQKQDTDEKIKLPIKLRRRDFTRAEILGHIGMIPMKKAGERFSIKYANTQDFLSQIDKIASASGASVLTIKCDADEFNQFKRESVKAKKSS